MLLIITTACKKEKKYSFISSSSIKDTLKKHSKIDLKNWQLKDIELDTIPGISLERAYDSLLQNKKGKEVIIAVDVDRVNGINQLKKLKNSPEIILLDDAFQHRKVEAGLNILLTPYNDLYINDAMLPSGNLRESRLGATRAQIIIVTKCPSDLSEKKQLEITSILNATASQSVFFSSIEYATVIKDRKEEISLDTLKGYQVLLVTGIANPTPLLRYLKSVNVNFEHLKYPDHHDFSDKEIKNIKSVFNKISSNKKLILTTEKDFVRLENQLKVRYLEIKTKFINHKQDFDKKIRNYVEQSSRNS